MHGRFLSPVNALLFRTSVAETHVDSSFRTRQENSLVSLFGFPTDRA
jgi:hypothetical protein